METASRGNCSHREGERLSAFGVVATGRMPTNRVVVADVRARVDRTSYEHGRQGFLG